jgi:hypothetical protein
MGRSNQIERTLKEQSKLEKRHPFLIKINELEKFGSWQSNSLLNIERQIRQRLENKEHN